MTLLSRLCRKADMRRVDSAPLSGSQLCQNPTRLFFFPCLVEESLVVWGCLINPLFIPSFQLSCTPPGFLCCQRLSFSHPRPSILPLPPFSFMSSLFSLEQGNLSGLPAKQRHRPLYDFHAVFKNLKKKKSPSGPLEHCSLVLHRNIPDAHI